MDTLLVPAALLLALTNLSFALLALSWKRKAQASERALLDLTCQVTRREQRATESGIDVGLRRACGDLYRAALRADCDDGVLTALRHTGKRLLGESMEEPIVQVPVEA